MVMRSMLLAAAVAVGMSAGAGGRRFPNDIEFGESFKNFAQYGRGYTRYVLLRLEEAFGHKERVDLSDATIEHIMPQSWEASWPPPSRGSLQDRAQLVHALGNLTLLTSKLNAAVSNGP